MRTDRHHRKGQERLPPFVPLLISTLDSAAWRAMSHGAKVLYIALKRRYSPKRHNNGRIFLSQRSAEKELRSGTDQISRWFRELQHYGFIVQTRGGSLGIDGKGKAPHWRLTEIGCGYNHHGHDDVPGSNDSGAPTRDFMRWNGAKFRDRPRVKKTESRPQFQGRAVPEIRDTPVQEIWDN